MKSRIESASRRKRRGKGASRRKLKTPAKTLITLRCASWTH